MKMLKLILAGVCTVLMFAGIIYRVAISPFSSPLFDLLLWIAIGAAIFYMRALGK